MELLGRFFIAFLDGVDMVQITLRNRLSHLVGQKVEVSVGKSRFHVLEDRFDVLHNGLDTRKSVLYVDEVGPRELVHRTELDCNLGIKTPQNPDQ